jgi:hypothetical protein
MKITCEGSVRGVCGHTHRTIEGAVRCIQRDASGCQGQGGYSDRMMVGVDDAGAAAIEDYYCNGNDPLLEEL